MIYLGIWANKTIELNNVADCKVDVFKKKISLSLNKAFPQVKYFWYNKKVIQ